MEHHVLPHGGEQIYHMAKQLDEGRSLVYVISELQQMDIRRELTGPVLEILTARE